MKGLPDRGGWVTHMIIGLGGHGEDGSWKGSLTIGRKTGNAPGNSNYDYVGWAWHCSWSVCRYMMGLVDFYPFSYSFTSQDMGRGEDMGSRVRRYCLRKEVYCLGVHAQVLKLLR